jgi:uncharacterized protein YukJ
MAGTLARIGGAMPLSRYGVLKGVVLDRVVETTDSPHYQIHLRAKDTDFRVAVNVRSSQHPHDLLYLADDDFTHPVTSGLVELPEGFTELDSRAGGLALDFIRGNLFDRLGMREAPTTKPGPDNDLGEFLDHHVQRALGNPDVHVYVFGERWGPESTADKIFGFRPGNGVHDVHMNQGNSGAFVRDDGVWQDGAVLIHLTDSDRWVGIFLAFQSQAWHTDDVTGHRLPDLPEPGPGPKPGPSEPDHLVRIVAALVNPTGPAPERETVTLVNASPDGIDLDGWVIIDRLENQQPLRGVIAPGAALMVAVEPPVQLSNKGGIISLLNREGLKVDGVVYTAEQARRQGWTIVF